MAMEKKLFSFLVFAGTSWACFLARTYFSHEREWYLIRDIMNLSGNPPFQHRMLLVWLAKFLQASFPQLSEITCFYLSQILPILLSFYAIKKWAELFIEKELADLGPLLLAVMLIPTFSYYTFYDIAIVFFYTICLKNLMKREFVQYLVFFTIGTINHEITLFLIFIFAFIYYDSDLPRSHFIGILALQILAYLLVRAGLFYYLPASTAWEPGKIWWNINYLLHDKKMLVVNLSTLIFWYVTAMLGFKYAMDSLKRCLILLPMLVAMTLVFGQLNEARQFDAFIPVAIGLILTFISSRRVNNRIVEPLYAQSRQPIHQPGDHRAP